MELSSWMLLASISLMGAMTPGPSLALIMGNTIKGGQAHGVATALGHGIGVGLYALITAMGLSVIIKQIPQLFDVIYYGGAIFLVWLGIRGLFAGKNGHQVTMAPQDYVNHKGLFEGFMIAFLNPQLLLFLIALFSQFLQLESGWYQGGIIMLTVGMIDTYWYVMVVLVLSSSMILPWLSEHAVLINRLSSAILLGLGLYAIF